jgi:hypothetical protein
MRRASAGATAAESDAIVGVVSWARTTRIPAASGEQRATSHGIAWAKSPVVRCSVTGPCRAPVCGATTRKRWRLPLRS